MLKHKPIETQTYSSFEHLKHDAGLEEDKTSYDPVPSNIVFEDDQWINNKYNFNTHGIKALCQATNVNGLFNTMEAMEHPHMSSTFLNKLFDQQSIKNELASKRLVVNGDTIVGVVGSRYLPYSNFQFLYDLFRDDKNDSLELERATITNTKMTANFVEKHGGFKMKDGEDFTKIGISARNSGVGDTKVSTNIFTLRPRCLNGMMHYVKRGTSSAKHTGMADVMKYKLDQIITLAKDQYEVVKERVQALTQVPYTNTTADTFLKLQAPVDILPQLRKAKLWTPKKKFSDVTTHQEDLTRSIQILNEVPTKYGGVHTLAVWNSTFRDQNSMYEWVEAFTEHAQTLPAEVQLEVEQGAGELTAWISDHKEKLGYLPF
jgi:hypothetical protein